MQKEVLEFAKKLNIKKLYFKARSPSCGTGKIYSGNFDGKLIQRKWYTSRTFNKKWN